MTPHGLWVRYFFGLNITHETKHCILTPLLRPLALTYRRPKGSEHTFGEGQPASLVGQRGARSSQN